jgi:2-keto-3-deoxy-6-phosphogluconate aldolase
MSKYAAVFMFIAPGADPEKDRAVIDSASVKLTVVGVADYDEACKVAAALATGGVDAFELCPGFDDAGVAAVKSAVQDRAKVGVVKFG